MKPTVYLESSVVSYYNGRPTRDLIVAAHQEITRDWWDNRLDFYEIFISPVVMQEISDGNPDYAKKRVDSVDSFQPLAVNEDVQRLANLYLEEVCLPKKAAVDCLHIALSSFHGMDILVTWNCTHIANANSILRVQKLNNREGLETPIICTPEELLGD